MNTKKRKNKKSEKKLFQVRTKVRGGTIMDSLLKKELAG